MRLVKSESKIAWAFLVITVINISTVNGSFDDAVKSAQSGINRLNEKALLVGAKCNRTSLNGTQG